MTTLPWLHGDTRVFHYHCSLCLLVASCCPTPPPAPASILPTDPLYSRHPPHHDGWHRQPSFLSIQCRPSLALQCFFSAQPLATVPPHFRYAVTSALYRMRWLPSSLHIAPTPPQPHGTHGSPSAMLSTSTPSYQTSLIKFQSYKVLPATTAIDSSPPPNDRSGLARWKMTCVRQVAHSDIQHQHGDQWPSCELFWQPRFQAPLTEEILWKTWLPSLPSQTTSPPFPTPCIWPGSCYWAPSPHFHPGYGCNCLLFLNAPWGLWCILQWWSNDHNISIYYERCVMIIVIN